MGADVILVVGHPSHRNLLLFVASVLWMGSFGADQPYAGCELLVTV